MDLDIQPPNLADVTGLQTFIVDTVIRRDLGDGIASIINCRTVNGLIIPQCEIIIAGKNLFAICKAANDFALEVRRRQEMARMTEFIGSRH